MWGKIIIPMYMLWLNGLYGLYGPRCPLSSKRPINLISLSLSLSLSLGWGVGWLRFADGVTDNRITHPENDDMSTWKLTKRGWISTLFMTMFTVGRVRNFVHSTRLISFRYIRLWSILKYDISNQHVGGIRRKQHHNIAYALMLTSPPHQPNDVR